MKVCPQCNGKGVNQGTEDIQDESGNSFTIPNVTPILCSGCNGTGQYNCFGAS